MMKKINALDYKENEIIPLEWEEDEIEFWFGDYEVYDSREERCNLKRTEKMNSLGLGSNTYNIERTLRKDMKDRKWKEPERRGSKSKNMKYKKFDLLNGYVKKRKWQIRMKVNSEGKLWFWMETM